MKGRLSSTVWTLVAVTLALLVAVFVLGYGAGAKSGGLAITDAFSGPSGTGMRMLLGGLLCLAGAGYVLYVLDHRVIPGVAVLMAKNQGVSRHGSIRIWFLQVVG